MFLPVFLSAQGSIDKDLSLRLDGSDVIVEQAKVDGQNGYMIYVRQKNGVSSVMFLDTSKDPEGKRENYAYRAKEYNSVNGDEIRILNGKVLESEYAKFSLISSTIVEDVRLGKCFRVFMPETVVFGYPWSRNGTVTVQKGTFVNIRTFEKPYGSYEGAYRDNPFMFDLAPVQENPIAEVFAEKEVVLSDKYSVDAAEKFNEIAKQGNGILRYSSPEKLTGDLLDSLESINPKDVADVIFAIDTTGSMNDDMEALRKEWVPKLLEQLKEFEDIRLGLIFYRDYGDNYNTNGLPVKLMDFTYSTDLFIKTLDSVKIIGKEGGDIPEAVYEALYSGLEYYGWRPEAQKKIILIGDAEPHNRPKGTKNITQNLVIELATKRQVTLDCIIVPSDSE